MLTRTSADIHNHKRHNRSQAPDTPFKSQGHPFTTNQLIWQHRPLVDIGGKALLTDLDLLGLAMQIYFYTDPSINYSK